MGDGTVGGGTLEALLEELLLDDGTDGDGIVDALLL